MNETLLSVRDLKVRFDTEEGEVKAVDGVSFDVIRGEVFAIVGESGSGKSVTAMSMLGLIPNARIASGEAWWKETDLLKASDAEMRRIRGGEIAMRATARSNCSTSSESHNRNGASTTTRTNSPAVCASGQ